MTAPIFRIDDIGACTKQFEQYGKKVFRCFGYPIAYFPFSDFGPLKRIFPFRMWGPYEELHAEEWCAFLNVFRKYSVVPLIAITATWVDEYSRLIPFPEKFPEEAAVLKRAADRKEICVANHGLTHCVIGKHLPQRFHSNRAFHREFFPALDQSVHTHHIKQSQLILETYFERDIDTLVPPGNVWSIKTYRAVQDSNIRKIICARPMADANIQMVGVEYIDDNKGFVRLHDRELRYKGSQWLEQQIIAHYSGARNSSLTNDPTDFK